MRNKILATVITALLVGISYPVLDNYIKQEDLLFMRSPLPLDHEFSFSFPYEEKIFSASNGGSIHCIRMKVENPKGVVVYYHGQQVNIETKGKDVSRLFNNRDYDVVMLDYRGFGKSRGPLNEATLYQDCLISYDWAKSLYGEENIIIYGCSLGTSMAAFVSSKTNPKMVILESPYYNMIELGKFIKPYYPLVVIEAILKYPMRTDLFLENTTCPIYFFHGTNDTIIPYECSAKLFNKFKTNKPFVELVTIEGADHYSITKTFNYHQKLDSLLR